MYPTLHLFVKLSTIIAHAGLTLGFLIPRSASLSFLSPQVIEQNGMHNIHVTYNAPLDGDLFIHYGTCERPAVHSRDSNHATDDMIIGSHSLSNGKLEWQTERSGRFVWLVPGDVQDGGCLHAYLGLEPVGSSEPLRVVKKFSRRGTVLADIADAEGPWFDGVEYLKQKEPDEVFVAREKGKTVGIIGAGMSGLMSAVSPCKALLV